MMTKSDQIIELQKEVIFLKEQNHLQSKFIETLSGILNDHAEKIEIIEEILEVEEA